MRYQPSMICRTISILFSEFVARHFARQRSIKRRNAKCRAHVHIFLEQFSRRDDRQRRIGECSKMSPQLEIKFGQFHPRHRYSLAVWRIRHDANAICTIIEDRSGDKSNTRIEPRRLRIVLRNVECLGIDIASDDFASKILSSDPSEYLRRT